MDHARKHTDAFFKQLLRIHKTEEEATAYLRIYRDAAREQRRRAAATATTTQKQTTTKP